MTGSADFAPSVTVVVATRERSEGCRRLCAAVEEQLAQQQPLRGEIVLVFDGCPPYDWYRPTDLYRGVRLESRVGIARARNAGIEAASGDVLAFLDDDAVPVAGWLSSLLRALDAYPQIVAFGGRVMGSDRVNLYAQLRDQVYYRETFGPWYVNDGDNGDLIGPPYVNGGNSAYRREAVLGAGGFDSILPAYSDVELGRRLRLDRRGALVAGMAIHHDHPSTFRQYMLRCYRSGRARGMLWARYRYRQDAPRTVAAAILVNVAWYNPVRRARRIDTSRMRTSAVLFCQEVLHGAGYARSLVRAR